MANTYLSKTLGTPTDNKKWTWSAWIKRGTGFNVVQRLFYAINSSNYTTLQFDDESNLIWFNEISGVGTDMQLKTTQLFRDAGAWYHIVIAYDSANSTAADRQIIYINGERVTSFVTENTATVNANTAINQAVPHTVGSSNGGGNYFNGLMTHVHFVDGTAYTASSFGSVDSTSGIWKINTSPSVTYGTNGFFILKDGNTITDSSSNSNNFSLGGGTLTNTKDCPSNVFATMNPLDNYWQSGTFSNGNNTVVTGGAIQAWSTSTIGMSSGKFYWEVKVATSGNDYDTIGISPFAPTATGNVLGGATETVAWNGTNGALRQSNSVLATFSTFTTGDILSFALDLDGSLIYCYKNGTVQNSGTGIAITAAASTSTGLYLVGAGHNDSVASTFQWNFGNGYFGTTAVATNSGNGYAGTEGKSIFNYQPPTGYSALSTKGLNL